MFSKFPRQFGIYRCNLAGHVEKGLQPEIGYIEDLVALFHESDRQQGFGKFVIGSQCRCRPGEQHGLASATGSDNENMLARRRVDVSPQDLLHKFELPGPDDKLVYKFTIRLQCPRVEFTDRTDRFTGRNCLCHWSRLAESSFVKRSSSGM